MSFTWVLALFDIRHRENGDKEIIWFNAYKRALLHGLFTTRRAEEIADGNVVLNTMADELYQEAESFKQQLRMKNVSECNWWYMFIIR